MINTTDEETIKYDLDWPGHRIEGEDRDWASETQTILHNIESEYIIAVASFLHYKPITLQLSRGQSYCPVSKYNKSIYMTSIYARSYVMSLYLIDRMLKTIENPPDITAKAISKYNYDWGYLKHIRDSIVHLEDRGRGLDKNGKKLSTNIIALGVYSIKGYDFTGNDGTIYHIDITEETLPSIRDILQKVIGGYSWM